jgi:uncharacterized membrane protein
MFADVVLVAATMTTGLMAGVFALFANTIMPALRRTDDRTFVTAFQTIDRSIVNPLFLSCFLGALVLIGLAGLLHLGSGRLPWIITAFVLYLATVVITMVVNVPRNDAIKAAGDPDRIDLAQTRRAFDEARWSRWNLIRVAASIVAFGLLVAA